MKKTFVCLLAVLLLMGILVACSNTPVNENTDKLSIVTTIFPEYDWVRQILGSHMDDIDITILLDNGVDLHSYQPTVDDIIKISTCDMFIYVGGESDGWVEEALKESSNKNMVVINLLEVLGDSIKEEEVKEGMEATEEDGEQEEFPEYDEHVWLSLKNAKTFCSYISDQLCNLDSENASDYRNNMEEYFTSLTVLDNEYQQAVDSAKHKTMIFGDRFPFRYMADDYKLDYYAAFVGCSAETEASFATITFLAMKVDELGLDAILTIEGTKHKIAETIISNTVKKNQRVLTMNSLQSTAIMDAENGATYLSIMKENLDVLKQALR